MNGRQRCEYPTVRIAVFQHASFEHAGILRDLMGKNGLSFDVTALDEGEEIPLLDPYDALVVLGGPMGPLDHSDHPWLIDETAIIREAVVERALPTLGICLGHQLLALALGGSLAEPPAEEDAAQEAPVAAAQPSFQKVGPATAAVGETAVKRVHGTPVKEPDPEPVADDTAETTPDAAAAKPRFEEAPSAADSGGQSPATDRSRFRKVPTGTSGG